MERYIDFITARYKLVLGLVMLLVVVLATGFGNLGFTQDLRVFFSEENPQLKAFEDIESEFVKQDALYFLVIDKNGDVLTEENLSLLDELTEAAWQLPYVIRVNSVTNYQHTLVDGDELTVTQLFEGGTANFSADEIKAIVLNEPMLVGGLIAKEGHAAGVQLTLSIPTDALTGNSDATNAARDLLKTVLGDASNLEFHVAGNVALNASMIEAVERDVTSMTGASYVLIFVGLVILLRSLMGTGLILALISLSLIASFGAAGWTHLQLTATAGLVPTIIMIIAIADAVHIITSYLIELNKGTEKLNAIKESMRINIYPIFLTSITTIVGFLCLNFSEAPPYRHLGNIVATGVAFAFIFSVTFMPAILTWLPAPKKTTPPRANELMIRLSQFVIDKKLPLFISISVITVVLASFVDNNYYREDWVNEFDDTFDIRKALDAVEENLGGAHVIHYVVDAGEPNGIDNPAYLNDLDKFVNWLQQQPEIVTAESITPIIKRLNKNLHNDDPTWYRIPEQRDLASQYMLLYEMSLPFGLGLDHMINVDRNATRVIVSVKKNDSAGLLAIDARVQDWAKQNLQAASAREGSSFDMVTAHVQQRNIESVMTGTAAALILISFILILALKSLRYGIVSLIPNLAPAALAYGTWALLVGQVNMMSALVICMSLGIVVDDTVHFLSKYKRARDILGKSTEDSVRYAFTTVGSALVTTSLVLIVGFSITTLSHFGPTRYAGALMSITLTYALLVDLFLLPALLIYLDRKSVKEPKVATSGLESAPERAA